MESLEVNKVLAAILVAGIGWMSATLISDGLVRPQELEKTAIKIEGVQAAPATAPQAPQEPSVAAELQTASVKKGETEVQRACAVCHTFTKGGPALVGPNLYGVVGRPVASAPGYDYSSALKSKKGPWTYAELYEWLKRPSSYAPGTKMSFAGIDNPQLRADVIDYLHTLSANPEPLPPPPKPQPAKTAAAAPGAPKPPSAAALVAHADVQKGEAEVQRACTVCHTVNKGGPIRVGPNLYNVVGRPVASFPGFDYSSALKSKKGPWTYAELFQWLKNPQAYAPGTKMTFAGIENPKLRADVIGYLRTLSPNPLPLPGGASAAKTGPKPASGPINEPGTIVQVTPPSGAPASTVKGH